jgi:hypothetical protein
MGEEIVMIKVVVAVVVAVEEGVQGLGSCCTFFVRGACLKAAWMASSWNRRSRDEDAPPSEQLSAQMALDVVKKGVVVGLSKRNTGAGLTFV